jgi:hypothetical protein
MQAKPIDPKVAERAIVMQVLRDDHDEHWTRTELEREASDHDPPAIHRALRQLRAEDVVLLEGDQIRASRCAHYLDTLDLLAI